MLLLSHIIESFPFIIYDTDQIKPIKKKISLLRKKKRERFESFIIEYETCPK